MNEQNWDVAVVGTGIVGLGLAYTAAKAGSSVIMFERHPRAIGATIRNFGMVWPVGQPLETFERAMQSRAVWLELAEKAGFWAAPTGMMCAAYHDDELDVLEEFVETRKNNGYEIELLTPEKALEKSAVLNPKGLKGALWSATEVNVDPREATAQIHRYLQEAMGVTILYDTAVTYINHPWIAAGDEQWHAERVYVCSGADFETLYPEIYAASGITKCKLQMMRTTPQLAWLAIGTHVVRRTNPDPLRLFCAL
jgi:FAD dependent oxidoreductase TIGR03364